MAIIIKLLFCIGFFWPWFILIVGTTNSYYNASSVKDKTAISILSPTSAVIMWICVKFWSILWTIIITTMKGRVSMSKLHEVLAVEAGLKSTADSVINEACKTFSDKRGHFMSHYRQYSTHVDGGITFSPETKEMETTVVEKLDYVGNAFSQAIDCIIQKETTNTVAKADIIIDGIVIEKDLPATFLLTLEGKLKDLRKVYHTIPTLDPGKKWTKDSERKNVYVSDDAVQYKTQKVTRPLVLFPATDKFPAQVDKITVDEIIGSWTQKNWSGAITPAEKSTYLTKIDILIRAVKQARCRANETVINNSLKIGSKLLKFIA